MDIGAQLSYYKLATMKRRRSGSNLFIALNLKSATPYISSKHNGQCSEDNHYILEKKPLQTDTEKLLFGFSFTVAVPDPQQLTDTPAIRDACTWHSNVSAVQAIKSY